MFHVEHSAPLLEGEEVVDTVSRETFGMPGLLATSCFT